jgi:hypothetical protein
LRRGDDFVDPFLGILGDEEPNEVRAWVSDKFRIQLKIRNKTRNQWSIQAKPQKLTATRKRAINAIFEKRSQNSPHPGKRHRKLFDHGPVFNRKRNTEEVKLLETRKPT